MLQTRVKLTAKTRPQRAEITDVALLPHVAPDTGDFAVAALGVGVGQRGNSDVRVIEVVLQMDAPESANAR